MHVLLIHQAFVGPGEGGGTRHCEFMRHAASRGHRVTVIASTISYLTGRRTAAAAPALPPGLRVVRVYTPAILNRGAIGRALAFLCFMGGAFGRGMLTPDVDLVMGTSPSLFQAAAARLVALLRRRPFLLEIRDLWPEFVIEMGVLRNPALIVLFRRLEASLYRAARHIVVNSPAYRGYLLGRGVPEGRISVIPNGVDPAMFDPDADGAAVREEFGLAGKFVVTYAGDLGPANDLETVLDAVEEAADVPDLRLLLVGDGADRARLEASVRRRGLTGVTFAGLRSKERMKDVLAASDACVATLRNIPMFRTTYPNKVFDYMAAGRPTILGIDGAIRDVVEKAGGGIAVGPGNPRGLAEAMRALRRNPAQGRAMGRSARRYVVENFNRARHAGEFAALLEQVAGGAERSVSR